MISIVLVALAAHSLNLRHIQAQAYYLAASLSSSNPEQAYYYALRATDLVTDNAEYWNAVCRFGSLSKHTAQVLDACDRAVALAPDNGAIRDSRGLARALTGDVAGTIEDFHFYIQWAQRPGNSSHRSEPSKRETWIEKLRNGQFDGQTILKELR